MSQLTDAIKAKNTQKALDLISGTRFVDRVYKLMFDKLYGNLLEAPEQIVNESYKYNVEYRSHLKKYRSGYDPMQLAAEAGLTEVVYALLESGVAVQRTAPEQYSKLDYFDIKYHATPPLNLALQSGHDVTAMVLIEAGANVNTYSYTDLTFFGVPFNEHPLYLMNACVYAASPIYFAVTGRCSITTLRALVARGAQVKNSIKGARAFLPVNDPTNYRYLPYHGSILINAVARYDDQTIHVIEFLLQNGAELNKYIFYQYNLQNETFYRRHEKNFDFIKYANTYSPGTYNSAVTLAIRQGKHAIAKLLLSQGASTLVIDDFIRNFMLENRVWLNQVLPDSILERANQIELELDQFVDINEPNIPVPAQHIQPLCIRAFNTFVQPNANTRPIIQQELDKLIKLDPSFNDHEFDETLLCPIGRTLMIEPEMVIESCNTYDKSAICKWFTTHETDPMNGNRLSSKETQSNTAVKRIILAELQRLITAAQIKNTKPLLRNRA